MTSVRRALALSLAERYLLIVLALASNIILARLLTPAQIGIYSVSLAVIGIAQVLRDFGIGNFLIQEQNLSDDHIRTAFGLSLLIGGTLFAVVFIAAPWAGSFYGEARMVTTLRIASLNFLVLPFCTISLALLRREMMFQRLLVVTLAATAVGFVVTITLAYAGFGPDSMAAGAVLTNALTGLGTWLARAQRQMLWPALSQWRALLHFGAQSSAASIVTTISMDINDLALGKILGFAPVAMISRAQGLSNLFGREVMGAIRNVAFPAYARAHREGQPLEARYIASVAAVTVVAWPFYGFLALYAPEIVRLMYGAQWAPAVALVPVFAVAGAVAALTNLISSAILAVGRIDLITRIELVFQPLRALVIVVTALVFKSLLACAIAYLVLLVLVTPFWYAVKQVCIRNDWAALARELTRSLSVTLATLALPAVLALRAGLARSEPMAIAWFVLAIVAAAAAWLVSMFMLRHPLARDPLVLKLLHRVALLRPRLGRGSG